MNYAPELASISKYSREMMEWLAARGHEVRVITTPPYYNGKFEFDTTKPDGTPQKFLDVSRIHALG